MDGHCVRLVQGDFEKRTVYSDDPATIAEDFARAGATRLHVVDLDAARGAPDNRAVVNDIIEASGMSVQVAGGVRTQEQVAAWLEAGATNVVMGTAAVRDPELLARLAEKFPRGIIAALDIRDGQPVVSGWTETEQRDIPTLVARWEVLPLGGVVLTATERDGTLSGPDLETLSTVRSLTRHLLQYAGGISTLHDIRRVREAEAWGVILGRSLYEGKLSLEQALAL